MNYRIYLFWIALAIPSLSFGQVKFIEVVTAADMEAAQRKADDGMLMLFVDVYATWCGPCKMMDSQVYTDRALSDYMNEHFVNVRMDGETDFGRKYAAEQQLQGYPSMYIFSDDGKKVSSVVGFKPAADLLPLLENLVSSYKAVEGYRNKEEQGNISLDEYAEYISLLREMGNEDEARQIAGEYMKLKMGNELRNSDIRVVAYYTNLKDRWWPVFTMETERVKEVLGKEYVPVLETIYNNTLVMALQSEDLVLISRMANELAPLIEAEQEDPIDLKSMPFIQYFYYTGQSEELIKYIDTRFGADRAGDHRWLFGAASRVVDMDQQNKTPELLEKAEEWFSTCIELDEQYDYYFYRGMVYFFRQKLDEARESFESALELATTDDQRTMIEQVFKYINR